TRVQPELQRRKAAAGEPWGECAGEVRNVRREFVGNAGYADAVCVRRGGAVRGAAAVPERPGAVREGNHNGDDEFQRSSRRYGRDEPPGERTDEIPGLRQ